MDYIIDGVEEEIRDIVGSMIDKNNNENNNFNRTAKMQCKYKMLKALLQKVSKSTDYLSNIRNLRIILTLILVAGLWKKKSFFQEIQLNISYLFSGAYFFGREPQPVFNHLWALGRHKCWAGVPPGGATDRINLVARFGLLWFSSLFGYPNYQLN